MDWSSGNNAFRKSLANEFDTRSSGRTAECFAESRMAVLFHWRLGGPSLAGQESSVVATLLSEFSPRVSDAAEFALRSRVVLAQSSQSIAFDITLAGFDFEKAIIERGSWFEYADGIKLFTVSAEDLAVMKSFAGREQDWIDVRGILEANPELDQVTVLNHVKELSELQPEKNSVAKLQKLFNELNSER